jgi:hypothetical protein
MSKSIEEQLHKFTPKKGYANETFKDETDGVQHINIDRNAKTELGWMLFPEYEERFIHPVLGPFTSMTGFWIYIKSKSHSSGYRTQKPHACLLQARENNDSINSIDNFRALILSGNYYKAINNKKLCDLLKESTLKFEMYYTKIHSEKTSNDTTISYEIKVRQNYANWMLKIFEEVRKAIKEDREPDYLRFKDVKKNALYASFATCVEVQNVPVVQPEALVTMEHVDLEGEAGPDNLDNVGESLKPVEGGSDNLHPVDEALAPIESILVVDELNTTSPEVVATEE